MVCGALWSRLEAKVKKKTLANYFEPVFPSCVTSVLCLLGFSGGVKRDLLGTLWNTIFFFSIWPTFLDFVLFERAAFCLAFNQTGFRMRCQTERDEETSDAKPINRKAIFDLTLPIFFLLGHGKRLPASAAEKSCEMKWKTRGFDRQPADAFECNFCNLNFLSNTIIDCKALTRLAFSEADYFLWKIEKQISTETHGDAWEALVRESGSWKFYWQRGKARRPLSLFKQLLKDFSVHNSRRSRTLLTIIP